MASLPLVSIIIPCYNGERFVAEAIESALAQTYPHKEVIVIDDGSTDNSLEVIKSFGDKIRWETGPNRGGCAARNRGIELARGELIQFLDADDILHPQKLERQVPVATENEKSVCYCDFVVVDSSTGSALEIPKRESQGLDPVCFAVRAERLQTAAPLYRRSALLEVSGFAEGLPCAQEYDLNIRLACTGYSWHHLREVLYVVRRNPNSVSSDYVRILHYHKAILLNAVEVLKHRGEYTEERAEAIAGKLCQDARNFLRFGYPRKAREYFALARKIHPSGGLRVAYSRSSRRMRALLGAWLTEKIVMYKRTARGPKSYPGDEIL